MDRLNELHFTRIHFAPHNHPRLNTKEISVIVNHCFVSTLRHMAVYAAWCIISWNLQAAEPRPDYLSDTLADRITSSQAWGELGLNTAVKPAKGSAAKLRIKDQQYQHGLGHHANGEIIIPLEGRYKTFQCDIGVQWQGGKNLGTVVFQVFVDDKKAFESGPVRENTSPQSIRISVEGADTLRLVAADAGDGITCDCADWANARLTLDPAAKRLAAQDAVDVAAFARVVNSDPKRTGGTAANRVQELPAEDVFLETDLEPAADGTYTIPVTEGLGCIGLRWHEMRALRSVELHWANPAATPPADTVQLQYWDGESPWQGQWKPLPARLEQTVNTWKWTIAGKDRVPRTVRVRWLFTKAKTPLVVKNLSAYTRATWKTANLHIELQQPFAGKQAQVLVYNGAIVDSPAQSPRACTWDLAKPLPLSISYSKPQLHKADRTVLQFKLPQRTICVGVEDVLDQGCVYVPSVGLFVTTNPPQPTLSQYLQQIANKKTVLEDVRQRPDRVLADAMATVHNPIQNQGPTQISLACDNRKYVVERDGTIRFTAYDTPDGDYPMLVLPKEWWWIPSYKPYPQLVPQFGTGKGQLSRHLDGGWLPKPTITVTENAIKYRQCTYVAPLDAKSPNGCPNWYRQRAACVSEYTIQNTSPADANASLTLTFSPSDGKGAVPVEFRPFKDGLLAVSGDRVMALFDANKSAPLSLTHKDHTVTVTGPLTGGSSARLTVYLPAWAVKPSDAAVLTGATTLDKQVEQYWNSLFAEAMQIDIPDPLLANVIRASQVHCMVAARNQDCGRYVAPWIASMVYGPFESEAQSIIRGMDMCGQADFARRGLDYFLKGYNAQGYLSTGYTMVGTGEHLWTLAEYYQRSGDREWLKNSAPQMVRACQWIVRQRAKTKRLDSRGEKVPEYGLMTPGVTADWGRFAYRVFNDAQYCHGLQAVAQALAEIGQPEADALLADARAYREDLLRAYHWTTTRSPVVRLNNGAWVPNHPTLLDVFGNVEGFMPGEDYARIWAYSVEAGSHHLAANCLLDPRSDEVTEHLNYLEDYQFLRKGHQDYTEEQNHKDVFGFGGFAKTQPYYARNAEVYAMRDEVKPFIRSYFNAMSSLLNEENLSFWEHFHNTGGWNKTHETGWFLCQTAILFATDRGDELWLAPFVTNNWLKDGMTVAAGKIPTRFGPTSYRITSHVRDGYIEASVDSPKRNPPKHVVLRVRHPEGKPIASVTVDGKPHADFDVKAETVTLAPTANTQKLRIEY